MELSDYMVEHTCIRLEICLLVTVIYRVGFKKCSYELASIVTAIVNKSYSSDRHCSYWLVDCCGHTSIKEALSLWRCWLPSNIGHTHTVPCSGNIGCATTLPLPPP